MSSTVVIWLSRGTSDAHLAHVERRGGQREAAAMGQILSVKLNGLDPYRYLKDVLERLPSNPGPTNCCPIAGHRRTRRTAMPPK